MDEQWAYCRARSGLSPPSCCPCRAHQYAQMPIGFRTCLLYTSGKYTEIESLVKIGGFYRDMAYAGSSYLQAYRDENADVYKRQPPCRAGVKSPGKFSRPYGGIPHSPLDRFAFYTPVFHPVESKMMDSRRLGSCCPRFALNGKSR